jgi:MFS-type transporter involved in bile tolerance (Atg22 family)
MVMSVLFSAFVFPFVGKLCDSYSPKFMIPLAFLLRAFTTLMFYLVATPNSKQAYIACICMIIATIVENISVDTIFN